MELRAYLLRPCAAFHLGVGRTADLSDVEELPRSDTIGAALASLWASVARGSTPEDLARRVPFAVSSALPAVRAPRGPVILLPMPAGVVPERLLGEEGERARALRKARFVAPGVLRALLRGEDVAWTSVPGGCVVEQEIAGDFPDGLWARESRLRLTVDRLGDGPIEGLLYDFGAVRFREGARLALVAAFADPAVRPTFEAALRLLGDEGVGADRSAGYGRFEVEETVPFEIELGEGFALSLSLLSPTREEIESGLLEAPASYALAIRGGWVTSRGAMALRRRAVRMLTEGSVVRAASGRLLGRWPAVLEPHPELGLAHPVYRPGAAVTVPISWPPRGRSA